MRQSFILASAFLAAALFLAPPCQAFVLSPLDEANISVELTATGDTKAAALDAAKLDAVRGAVGRVYLTGRLTMADDLLSKYLAQYGSIFVKGAEVLKEEFVAGKSVLTARVYVDYEKLVRDLTEKRFLYKPAYKPRFATFMAETVDGKLSDSGSGRATLSEALNQVGMAPYKGEIATPPPSTDVTEDDVLLGAALVSAQRSGVEVIVTGRTETTLRRKKQLYYESYFFYDCEMTAKLLRVDTGEVLFEAKSFGSASDKDQDTASRVAVERASELVAKELQTKFDGFWPYVVQSSANFEVLLTGVDDEGLRIVSQHLSRLGPNTQIFLRKRFDRSAVLTIIHEGPKQDLLDVIDRCPYPTLSVIDREQGKKFEVQVSL